MTKYNGAFCSHVGLALKNKVGEMRFMHASRNYKKVVIDKTIPRYFNEFITHAGIPVGRPLEVSETVIDKAVSEANLKNLSHEPCHVRTPWNLSTPYSECASSSGEVGSSPVSVHSRSSSTSSESSSPVPTVE